MLKNEDKIFTNIYGANSSEISAAIRRGNWDSTKTLLSRGKDWIIEELKASGRGSGSGRFPTGLNGPSCQKRLRIVHTILLSTQIVGAWHCKDREILRNEPHQFIDV